jgi:sRNA-binding regulator protein Hfq
MAKVWINPAFKDKMPEKLIKKPVSKPVSKDFKKEERRELPGKFDRKKSTKPPVREAGHDPLLELKLLQYVKNNNAALEANFIEGINIKGKIKWFSEFMIGLELEEGKNVICNRLMMIYYRLLEKKTPSEKDIREMPDPDITNLEITTMQQLKDSKTALIFHMKHNVILKGTLEWYEKLIYHVRSIDGEKDYNIQKSSLIYFEEVPS